MSQLQDAKRVVWLQRQIQRIVLVREIRTGAFSVAIFTETNEFRLSEYGDGNNREGAQGAANRFKKVFVLGLARALAGVSFNSRNGQESPIAKIQEKVWESDHAPKVAEIFAEFIKEL